MTEEVATFDRLTPGIVLGRVPFTVSPEMLERWRGIYPELQGDADETAPPGLAAVIAIMAYTTVLPRRPPGGVHGAQWFRWRRPVRAGERLETAVRVASKELKGERRWVTIETSTCDGAGNAEISDDFNPLHVDEAFARTTAFGGVIAHGMLSLNLAWELVRTLPGVASIADVELDVRFHKPVRPGDTVQASSSTSSFMSCSTSCSGIRGSRSSTWKDGPPTASSTPQSRSSEWRMTSPVALKRGRTPSSQPLTRYDRGSARRAAVIRK